MLKAWLVLKYEYLRHVKQKRFIVALLSVPLFILVIMGISFLSVIFTIDNTPIGYVDNSQFLANPNMLDGKDKGVFDKPLKIIAYDSEQAAQTALDEEKIQAFFVLPADYLDTGKSKLVSKKIPDSNVTSDFRLFLRTNLLRNYDQKIAERVLEGPDVEIKAIEGGRERSSTNILGIALPIVAGILFMLAVNISGGYLLQAMVEEKENRTMEIIVTSISPTQLMVGKVIGNLSVGLTQIITWILFGALAVHFALQSFPSLEAGHIDTYFLVIMILTFLPAFVMVAAMMAAIGASSSEIKEAQQIASLFTIPIVIPFWFIGSIMANPNSPFSVFLSIFPFTAPVILPLRVALSSVPFWQITATILILVLIAIFSLWLAGRAFRLGLLRYGKRLSLMEIFQKAQV